MTQTLFTDTVRLQGSQDAPQLQIQANATQTQPLQNWQDSAGNIKAQVTGDGRFQIGNNLGAGAPTDALIQANNDIILPSIQPLSGWHTLGRITGALTGAVAWVVHEFQLLGSGGVSGLQTALRAKLTHSNTGASTTAELRAADFQSINQTGSSGTPVYRVTGMRGTASNTTNAYLTKAVGVESAITNDTGATISQASAFEIAPPLNAGSIGTLYGLLVPDLTQGAVNIAIQTGRGLVRIGDHEEIAILSTTPSGNPPTGLIKLYPKLNGGIPTLYAKDALGSEFIVGGGGTGSAPLALVGQNDNIQLLVKGNTTQINDLQQWQKSDGTVIASLLSSGSLWVIGQSDNIRLFAKGSTTQTNDLLQLQNSAGTTIHSVGGTGSTAIIGQADNIQLFVKGSTTQTNDLLQLQNNAGTTIHSVGGTGSTAIIGQADNIQLFVKGSTPQTSDIQQWQNGSGNIIAALSASGQLTTTTFKMMSGASGGSFLKSDSVGLASWNAIAAADLAGALAAPGPIGGNTPSTGAFSNLSIVNASASGSLSVTGQSDNIRLFAKGSTTQTNDLLQLQNSAGTVIHSVGGTGSTAIIGQADNIQLFVKGSTPQTSDIQQWQNGSGNVIAALSGSGQLTANKFKMISGASAGSFLKSDAAGLASWTALAGADIATALAAPSPIGSTTPSTGVFTTLKATTGAGLGKFLKSDATGLGSWNVIATADIATALTTPGPIGAATPSSGFFTALKATTGAGVGKFLQSDAAGNGTWQNAVSSVALTVPSFLAVVGSPITTSGTLAVTLATQVANQIFAGPISGGATAPTFRGLVAADLTTPFASPPIIGGTTPAAGTFTTLTGTTSVAATFVDAGTNNVSNIGLLTHNSSGAVALGLGAGLLFSAQSSTTPGRAQGRIRTQWITATDASRVSKLVLSAYDTAERDGLTIQASGSAPMIGFFGATPIIQPTGGVKTAAVTYAANEQLMLQTVYNTLRNFGLLS